MNTSSILLLLTSMLNEQELKYQQPQDLEELIEIIKETPTKDLRENLFKEQVIEEKEINKTLTSLLKRKKILFAPNASNPQCGSHCGYY